MSPPCVEETKSGFLSASRGSGRLKTNDVEQLEPLALRTRPTRGCASFAIDYKDRSSSAAKHAVENDFKVTRKRAQSSIRSFAEKPQNSGIFRPRHHSNPKLGEHRKNGLFPTPQTAKKPKKHILFSTRKSSPSSSRDENQNKNNRKRDSFGSTSIANPARVCSETSKTERAKSRAVYRSRSGRLCPMVSGYTFNSPEGDSDGSSRSSSVQSCSSSFDINFESSPEKRIRTLRSNVDRTKTRPTTTPSKYHVKQGSNSRHDRSCHISSIASSELPEPRPNRACRAQSEQLKSKSRSTCQKNLDKPISKSHQSQTHSEISAPSRGNVEIVDSRTSSAQSEQLKTKSPTVCQKTHDKPVAKSHRSQTHSNTLGPNRTSVEKVENRMLSAQSEQLNAKSPSICEKHHDKPVAKSHRSQTHSEIPATSRGSVEKVENRVLRNRSVSTHPENPKQKPSRPSREHNGYKSTEFRVATSYKQQDRRSIAQSDKLKVYSPHNRLGNRDEPSSKSHREQTQSKFSALSTNIDSDKERNESSRVHSEVLMTESTPSQSGSHDLPVPKLPVSNPDTLEPKRGRTSESLLEKPERTFSLTRKKQQDVPTSRSRIDENDEKLTALEVENLEKKQERTSNGRLIKPLTQLSTNCPENRDEPTSSTRNGTNDDWLSASEKKQNRKSNSIGEGPNKKSIKNSVQDHKDLDPVHFLLPSYSCSPEKENFKVERSNDDVLNSKNSPNHLEKQNQRDFKFPFFRIGESRDVNREDLENQEPLLTIKIDRSDVFPSDDCQSPTKCIKPQQKQRSGLENVMNDFISKDCSNDAQKKRRRSTSVLSDSLFPPPEKKAAYDSEASSMSIHEEILVEDIEVEMDEDFVVSQVEEEKAAERVEIDLESSEETMENAANGDASKKCISYNHFGYLPDKKKFKIPSHFAEAWKGHKNGSLKLKRSNSGYPSSKFSMKDWRENPTNSEDIWVVQAVYSCGNPEERYVVYEGWAANTGQNRDLSELKETSADFVEECDLRDDIVKAIEETTGRTFYDANVMRKEPKSIFWCYEDMTYFINQRAKKDAKHRIFFFLSTSFKAITLNKKFPEVEYLFKNYLTKTASEILTKNLSGQSVDRMMREHDINGDSKASIKKHPDQQCPSPSCKCDYRFAALYGNSEEKLTRFKYNSQGNLGIPVDFDRESVKFAMECSNSCGCSLDCPSRQMQKGQQVSLAILYDEKGFEVRAGDNIKKGQFITEYVGVVMENDEITNEDSYLMTIARICDGQLVIDATDMGNVSRYVNHSCDANAMFIEVHSRENEEELLVPRVGIYAIKDIKKGEEISVEYWNLDAEDITESKTSNRNFTDCLCKTAKCKGRIPKTSK